MGQKGKEKVEVM